MSNVVVDREGPVTIIAINRPEARNAVDGPTAAELHSAFEDFEADDTASVAILTGRGGTFCAGADLKAVGTPSGNQVTVNGPAPMGPSRMHLKKPVIAAIEGYAVAGGLELAVWCDLRVAASDAILGVFCRRWGVPLIDGGTVRLPRLIGESHALDLILTGRGASGPEALAMGLVNRLSAPGEALDLARTLAHELCALPQRCLRSDRQSALEQWGMDEDTALANETTLGIATLGSGESLDGAARFAAGAGRHGEFQRVEKSETNR
ncbi:MAG: crotonase/enoyl-CoA hydratase family protein [Actinomycetes bacterium]